MAFYICRNFVYYTEIVHIYILVYYTHWNSRKNSVYYTKTRFGIIYKKFKKQQNKISFVQYVQKLTQKQNKICLFCELKLSENYGNIYTDKTNDNKRRFDR